MKKQFTLAISCLVMAFSFVSAVNAEDAPYFTSDVRLECESHGYQEVCIIPSEISMYVRKITLVKNYSSEICVEGDNLEYGSGIYGRIITVSDGCRAQFNLELDKQRPVVDVLCESSGGNWTRCNAPSSINPWGTFPAGTQVWVKDRKSSDSCNREEDYTIYNNKLEVGNGCKAIFSYYPKDGWQ